MPFKILIVDDETDIVRSLSMRLKHAGYEVIVASDGLTAISMATRNLPDLILLDIGLPCGDGHLVATRLNVNSKTMGTPIIFLTARTSDANRAKATEAGVYAYVTKPFQADELLRIIERALSGQPLVDCSHKDG